MSDFEEPFIEDTSHWDPPSSPSLRDIYTLLDQTDNGQNPMTETFSLSIPNNQSDQRSSNFDERFVLKIEFQLPLLDRENISPFAAFFRSPLIVTSPNIPISPEFSPLTLLQYPNVESPLSQIPLPSITNNESLEMVQGSSEGNATTLVSISDLLDHQPVHIDHHPVHIDMPSQQDGDEDLNIDIIDVGEDENKDDHNIVNVDELEVGASSRTTKRRKYERASNMVGATKKCKQQRVIIHMECEEDHPDDGFRWRKYGEKVVTGNTNPRSYFRCTDKLCTVKKHVERGAEDAKLLVITYDGIHEHSAPSPRSFIPRYRNDSRLWLKNTMPPSKSLVPRNDMKQHFMTGLSKLPNLPVNQNSGLMHSNHQPVNHNPGFIFRSSQPTNQNSNFIFHDDQPVNHYPDSMYRTDQPVNQNPSFVSQNHQPINQNRGFMYQADQPINQNLDFMSRNDPPVNQYPDFMYRNDQPVNQNPSFVSQNHQPINQNRSFMYQTDQPTNQNLDFMSPNDPPVNQYPDSMYRTDQPVNQNPSFMSQNHQPINQNRGFMYQTDQPTNQNLDFMSPNDPSVNQYPDSMYRTDQPINQNPSFVSQNHQPINQNRGFMYQNHQPINQNRGFMYQ